MWATKKNESGNPLLSLLIGGVLVIGRRDSMGLYGIVISGEWRYGGWMEISNKWDYMGFHGVSWDIVTYYDSL